MSDPDYEVTKFFGAKILCLKNNFKSIDWFVFKMQLFKLTVAIV